MNQGFPHSKRHAMNPIYMDKEMGISDSRSGEGTPFEK